MGIYIVNSKKVHDVNIHHTWRDKKALLIELDKPVQYLLYKTEFGNDYPIEKKCSTKTILVSQVYNEHFERFEIAIFPVDRDGFKFTSGMSETLHEEISETKFDRINFVINYVNHLE